MSGARSPRVAFAAFFHETNTFAERPTDIEGFRTRGRWLEGEDLVTSHVGTRTVGGGMLAGAHEHGLEPVPLVGAFATPSGLVTRSAFEEIRDRMVELLSAAGEVDGLLLELHGALVVEASDDPESELLGALRAVIGDLPIAVVTDMHANMTARRTELVDILVGYRTNPHVDTFEAGHDAARHLARILAEGLATVTVHGACPVTAPPIAQRTVDQPLVGLLNRARELERHHRFLDVTVHAGFSHADVTSAGLSFTVTALAQDGDAARDAVAELVAQAWRGRDGLTARLPDVPEALDAAIALARRTNRTVAVADTGDNINGGSAGDATHLLAATLERGCRAATTLWDPEAVQLATQAGVGARLRLELGGRSGTLVGTPVAGEVEVVALGDGTFTNTGPMAHGARVTMGPAAVVRLGSVDIVLQTLPVQPNDLQLFRSMGVEPGEHELVLLKGAAAIRAGWAPEVAGFIDAGTPGVTDCDLSRLRYQRLRDVWPLVEDPTGAPAHAD